MDNKLSELSKPAWIVGEKEIADFMSGDEALLVRGHDPESTEPALRMYSQEYVSALLADNEGMEQSLNIANDATRLWKERAKSAESKLESVQAIANEYQQLMYHMDAGGDFFEFQRDKNNG